MTELFIIKVANFVNTILKSYQSQCICIFNECVISKYGKQIQLKTQFYLPSRMTFEISLVYIIELNKAFGYKTIVNIAFVKTFEWQIKFQNEISRVRSPLIDSSILAQFFSHMADNYSFTKMCYHIEGKIIYRGLKHAAMNYGSNWKKKNLTPALLRNQVVGLELRLHGRIPREAVRPRKTVQSRILGRSSMRQINKSTFITNRAERVNPELGTFSIWIRQVI